MAAPDRSVDAQRTYIAALEKLIPQRTYIAALEKLILDEGCGRRCCVCDAVFALDESVEAYTDRGPAAWCLSHAPAWATA